MPLALDQAGAYIEVTQCSLADYQQEYQVQQAKLLALRDGPAVLPGALKDDHPEPVATTWSLSFAKVEQASPLAAELLRACAFLAPDAIPEELLVEMLKTPLPSAKKQQGWGGWFSQLTSGVRKLPKPILQATSGEGLQETVPLLRAYSLLQRNTKEKMVRVHQLVQAVVRDALEERVQDTWIIRVVRAVNQRFPEVSFEAWEECERYLPHALACHGGIAQRQLQLREGATLLNQAALYLSDRARYAEAEPLYVRALDIREQQLGARHPDTAREPVEKSRNLLKPRREMHSCERESRQCLG